MTTLIKSLGKPVYVCGNDIDTFSPTSVFVKNDIKSFRKVLNTLTVSEEENLKAAHGILTSAVSIPNNTPSGTEIFLIVPEANSEKESFIVTIESIYLLQKVIEAMVGPDSLSQDDQEDVIDYLTTVEEQEIENIFILYGYSMDLTYDVPDSELQSLVTEKNYRSLKNLLEYQACA